MSRAGQDYSRTLPAQPGAVRAAAGEAVSMIETRRLPSQAHARHSARAPGPGQAGAPRSGAPVANRRRRLIRVGIRAGSRLRHRAAASAAGTGPAPFRLPGAQP